MPLPSKRIHIMRCPDHDSFREDGKELYIEAATGMNWEVVSEEELIRGYIPQ